ncbi:hypothetical protein PV326_012150 [Microctonus aethiopoides]|nr:hypothetical protein PV326_012150 [Microctonus aethiopoides]
MADSRGFKPINQLWSGTVSADPDSECLYEEISGLSTSLEPERRSIGTGTNERVRVKRKVNHEVSTLRRASSAGRRVFDDKTTFQQINQFQQQTITKSAPLSPLSPPLPPTLQQSTHSVHAIGTRVEEQYGVRRFYGESISGDPFDNTACNFKLTRGRIPAQYHHYHHYTSSVRRPGARPTPRHHFPRGAFSDETQEEIQEDDEATLRELLVRYVRNFIISHVLYR